MKGKFGTFILFLIMLILLGGIIFFAYAIYTDFLNSGVTQTIHTSENSIAVQEPKQDNKKSIGETISSFFVQTTETEKTYTDYFSVGKYFYEQLSETQKKIYNGLQENKDNLIKGDYKIEFGNQFKSVLERRKW